MTISNLENLIYQEANVQYIPVATATEVSIGELAKWVSATHIAAPFDAQGDASALIGVFGGSSLSTESDPVKIYKKGVFEFDVAAGAAHYEDEEYAWSAAPRTVVASTSNQVGRLFERISATDTKVRLKIDAYVIW
jgi:hypothetical protein